MPLALITRILLHSSQAYHLDAGEYNLSRHKLRYFLKPIGFIIIIVVVAAVVVVIVVVIVVVATIVVVVVFVVVVVVVVVVISRYQQCIQYSNQACHNQ